MFSDGLHDAPEFLVRVSVKNNRLHKMRTEAGLTVGQLREKTGVNLGTYAKLVGLRLSPKTKKGKWRIPVKRLAKFFKCCEEDLFPPNLESVINPSASKEVRADEIAQLCAPQEQLRLMAPDPEQVIIGEEVKHALYDELGTLTAREETVIRMRFGLGDEKESTLEEIGKHFGVGRQRIREIEAKALHKLRHPARAKKITETIPEEFW